MTYSKPEVKNLGEAKKVIELFPTQKIQSTKTDGQPLRVVNPAYDLDE